MELSQLHDRAHPASPAFEKPRQARHKAPEDQRNTTETPPPPPDGRRRRQRAHAPALPAGTPGSIGAIGTVGATETTKTTETSNSPAMPAKFLTPPVFLVLASLVAALAILSRNFFNISAQQAASSLADLTPKDCPSLQVDPTSCLRQRSPPLYPQESSQQTTMAATEQTFIAIKPDGVQRGLIGPIISRFEQRGYKLVAIKLITPGKEHLEKHYADLKDKPFFPGLISYMLSGPICAMIWEGRDAVKTGRTLLGATNPLASAPGTIRGDFAIDVGRNVCHGSDSVENAKREIALWFNESEIVGYKSSQFNWIYEKP